MAPMGVVRVERTIGAPPEQVWAVYTDHVSWQDWSAIGKVQLQRAGDPPPNGAGCVRVISKLGVTVFEEVLSFEPPRRMTYRVVRGGIPIKNHLGEVVFETRTGDSTRIVWSCQFDSKIPGLDFVWRRLIRKVFSDTLEALARNRFAQPVRPPA